MKNQNNEWLEDYQAFIDSDRTAIPPKVTETVFFKINDLLNPSAWLVFFKILGVHLVTGLLSLSFCHQFDLNPFKTQSSLTDWFTSVGGHHFCMLACGVLFVGLGILAAGLVLTVEEVKALKRTEFLQNFSLGIISLGLFAAFGAELILSIGIIWLLGGLIGGFIATLTVWKMKTVTI